jgi:PKD repeat protein
MDQSRFLISIILLLSFLGSNLNAQTTAVVLRPGPGTNQDAMIVDVFPTNNYSTHEDATISKWTAGGTPSTKRFFIKFDYSSIPVSSIDSAKLFWYCNTVSTSHGGIHTGQNDFSVYNVASAWTPSTVNWSNQPALSSLNTVSVLQSISNTQDYVIDVTPIVNDHLSSGVNFGFGMKLNDETPYRSVVCSSGDHPDPNKRPKLVVYYSCVQGSPQFNHTKVTALQVSFSPAPNLNAGTTHMWNFGDGYMSTLPNPTHTYALQGSYAVCHTVTDSCGTATTCDTISLCDSLSSAWNHTNTGLTVQFTSVNQTASSYDWDFGDGYSATLPNPVHTYTTFGLYQACLTASDSCGTYTTCSVLELNGIGMHESNSTKLFLQPIPAQDFVQISGISSDTHVKIQLKSATGQLVRVVENSSVINLANVPSGMYLIDIEFHGTVHHFKILKH